jgi:hypothetical protein
MRRVFRRLLAHVYYLKRPTLGFLPLLLGTTLLILVGGFCFQHLYTKDTLSFGAATYRTYCMIFMEHHGEYPDVASDPDRRRYRDQPGPIWSS